MTIRTSLLTTIIADPADDLARLAFADLCEEHGDDDRAEFIRVQIELAQTPEDGLCAGSATHDAGCPDRRECNRLVMEHRRLARRQSDLFYRVLLPDLGRTFEWHLNAWRNDPNERPVAVLVRSGFVDEVRVSPGHGAGGGLKLLGRD